ncbi:conserved hypothetical protein [Ricinus communis]|uniref:Cytochrome P450 n=1 Tax=Ricinus communis TaxID=3988 RepID=B9S656_RICCO|nr:conserved hypothetical protein [Ricinus communis]
MAILLLGLLMAFFSTTFLWFWWRNRSSLLINWPVVGMIPGLFSNLYHLNDFVTCILLQSEGTFLFKGPWFSGMNFLVTSDLMIVHHTLSKNFANYQIGAEFKISKGLLSVLDDALKLGCEVDIQDVFRRFTFDSICLLVLSFDPECLSVEFPHVLFEKAFDDIEEHMEVAKVASNWRRQEDEKSMGHV